MVPWAWVGAGGAALVAGAAAWRLGAYLSAATPQTEAARLAQLEEISDRFQQLFPEVPEITAAELRALLDSDGGGRVVVVDVRLPEERAVAMIPPGRGAVVAADEFEADPQRWRGYTVVAQCTAGYRSGLYAQKLLAGSSENGLSSALNLRGGILAVTHAGQGLIDPKTGDATRKVHVYAPRWALQADGFAPVTFRQPLFKMLQERVSSALGFKRKVD